MVRYDTLIIDKSVLIDKHFCNIWAYQYYRILISKSMKEGWEMERDSQELSSNFWTKCLICLAS